jgi:serine protease AprX
MISSGNYFQPDAKVNKQELVYSLVQGLGLEAKLADFTDAITVEYNGVPTPVMDSNTVDAESKGYVEAAIDMSLMSVMYVIEQGPYDLSPKVVAYFEPEKNVKRGDYAVIIGRLYDSYLRE